MTDLTRYQKYSLELFKKEFGDKWFVCSDTFGLAINRPRFTLETLHVKGVLLRKRNETDRNLYSDDFWIYSVSAPSSARAETARVERKE